MGTGFSEDDAPLQSDDGDPKAPRCDAHYLHWLLSDPARVNEAFKPVWQPCVGAGADEQTLAPKAAVLEVLLRVVGEFERSAEPSANAERPGRTARQLSNLVDSLPDRLSRADALRLFRTALLSLQAVLVMRAGSFQWPLDPQTPLPDSPSAPSTARPSVRGICKAEDLTPPRMTRSGMSQPTRRLQNQLSQAFASAAMKLPSRQELEVENEQLQRLSELVAEKAMEERRVVQVLEEESQSEVSGELNFSDMLWLQHGDTGLTALEAKTAGAETEVGRLQTTLALRNSELASAEGEVSSQQAELQRLSSRRAQEEATAQELGREARDLALELKSSRRSCVDLESEIASEESRAASLREAFEGRRARFTTAETAARNAELSTMRATRRRVAAESAARKEAVAVEEVRTERSMASAEASARIQAMTAELAHARSRGLQRQLQLDQAASATRDRATATAQAMADTEATLWRTRRELQEAEKLRDQEVAVAHSSAGEVAELEVARARLEGQLAGYEGELQVAHRRQQLAEAQASSSAASSGSARSGAMLGASGRAELAGIDVRTAEIQRRELLLQEELRRVAAPSANPEDQKAVDAAWQRALHIGQELGEARAALIRRRAQRHTGGSQDSVVAALRDALQSAQGQADLGDANCPASPSWGTGQRSPTWGTGSRASPETSQHHSMEQSPAHSSSNARCALLRQRIAEVESELAVRDEDRLSAASTAPESGFTQSLRLQVKRLEAELDQKEEVILRLDRIATENKPTRP